ncbi:hypothetical protein SAMN05444421_101424 [Celeribacter marinus]|nr:hypothetical protein SAMN05444421_101424 [Celeribacter marinus]
MAGLLHIWTMFVSGLERCVQTPFRARKAAVIVPSSR